MCASCIPSTTHANMCIMPFPYLSMHSQACMRMHMCAQHANTHLRRMLTLMMRSASHAHTLVRRMLTCMCTTCLCTRQLRKHDAHFTTFANPLSPHAQRDADQFHRIWRVRRWCALHCIVPASRAWRMCTMWASLALHVLAHHMCNPSPHMSEPHHARRMHRHAHQM